MTFIERTTKLADMLAEPLKTPGKEKYLAVTVKPEYHQIN